VCLIKRYKKKYEAKRNRVEKIIDAIEYPDIEKVIIIPIIVI
jgi:hypothetical protein